MRVRQSVALSRPGSGGYMSRLVRAPACVCSLASATAVMAQGDVAQNKVFSIRFPFQSPQDPALRHLPTTATRKQKRPPAWRAVGRRAMVHAALEDLQSSASVSPDRRFVRQRPPIPPDRRGRRRPGRGQRQRRRDRGIQTPARQRPATPAPWSSRRVGIGVVGDLVNWLRGVNSKIGPAGARRFCYNVII